MSQLEGFVQLLTSNPFEFKSAAAELYMESIKWTSFSISIGYVVLILLLKTIMNNFKAFQLTSLLNFWNAWLTVFSIVGSVITGYALFWDIVNHGLDYTYCTLSPTFWSGLSGYTTWLFAMSKIAELGDTILIVLRKKPLIFLHVYHHVFTLNYGIMSYVTQTGINTWIVWLNLTVHSIMYGYYMARSMHIKIPAAIAQLITTSQITQFIITLAILARIAFLAHGGATCHVSWETWTWCSIMEVSYVILFGNFFYQAYVRGGGKKYNAEKSGKNE